MLGNEPVIYSQWVERFEDDELYCLSAESCVCSPSDLGIDVNMIDHLGASFLIKTSGSSGEPKWVVYTKRRLIEHAKLVNAHLDIKAEDNLGLMLPVYHVGGLGVVARSIASGAKLIVFDQKWSASIGIEFLKSNLVSVVSLVPAQIVDLVRERCCCPVSMRVVIVGGGKLDDAVRLAAVELGWTIYESYGMTETGSQIATGALGTSGYIKIINGWELQVSEAGLLEVKGDCLMNGYLVREADGYVFRDPKCNGWFRTSDRVELKSTECGEGLKFLGRSDQLVKVLGELVDVSHLEEKLKHAVGAEAVIITIKNERRGVRLVPVLTDENSAKIVRSLPWSGLKRLADPIIVDAFPRNEMGKLERSKLEQMVESIVFPAG